MPVHTEVDTATGRGTLTFVLADDRHDAPISVVGSLNQWMPGVDVLQPQAHGPGACQWMSSRTWTGVGQDGGGVVDDGVDTDELLEHGQADAHQQQGPDLRGE